MPNILDSLWNSMALFLSALFFHGMALRSIREKKPAWFQIKFANEFINYALGIYYGLLGVYLLSADYPAQTLESIQICYLIF